MPNINELVDELGGLIVTATTLEQERLRMPRPNALDNLFATWPMKNEERTREIRAEQQKCKERAEEIGEQVQQHLTGLGCDRSVGHATWNNCIERMSDRSSPEEIRKVMNLFRDFCHTVEVVHQAEQTIQAQEERIRTAADEVAKKIGAPVRARFT